jgi:hypothetical protein
MSNADNHFAELVKNLKSDGGVLHFKFITKWYNKYYVTVNAVTVHNYISSLVEVIGIYVDDNKFMSMGQLMNALCLHGYQEAYRQKFKDLSDEMNDRMHYRILAELCGKLVWTEWEKIPGHDTV